MSNRHLSEQGVPKLGELLDHRSDEEVRDAVHIAVVNAWSNLELRPGQHVGLQSGRPGNPPFVVPKADKLIGVVDPFLKKNVPPFKGFWLFLYPGTITGLVHVWQHPAFSDYTDKDVENARKWLVDFAALEKMTYDQIIKAATDYLDHGTQVSRELNEADSVPNEFWHAYEIVTGRKVEVHSRGDFFACCV